MGDLSAQVSHHAPIAVTTEDETVGRIANAIFEFLQIRGRSTAANIAKLVPGRRRYKLSALQTLLLSGKILRIGSGKKCDPFKYSVARVARPAPAEKPKTEAFFEEVIL